MSNNVSTLSVDEVGRIHSVLVADFASSGDPIGEMGLRDRGLLESAVGRQHTAFGSTMKYPDPLSSAATLTFGIACDHPFVNGNKRTALVSMLVHLDKNRLCLHQTREAELYQLMVAIADHSVGLRPDPRRPDKDLKRRTADQEVAAIREWLQRRTAKLTRGERPITYRQLRQVLSRFGITLKNPHSNSIDIVKAEQKRTLLRGMKVVEKRLGSIGYRDEGTEVSFKDLRNLRQTCDLTEEDGVDSEAFYDGADVVDAFVNRYRTVLRRLAKT